MAKKTETFTTRWGVAGELDAAMLERAANTYDEGGRAPWKVVPGQKGFAGLFFGGDEADEQFAAGLSQAAGKKVYLLDFDDEGSSVTELDGKKETRKRGHPVAFLKTRGIIAPGFEPRPASPVRSAVVVERASPVDLRGVVENPTLVVEPHARGALVVGNSLGAEADWAERLDGPIYAAHHDTSDGTFWVKVYERGRETKLFRIGEMANLSLYHLVDDVLGEKTPEGILRVLEVPRHLLYPDG